MIKKPFFSFGRTVLKYPAFQDLEKKRAREIPAPDEAIVHIKGRLSSVDDKSLKAGVQVRTGERVFLNDKDKRYFLAPLTGSIREICEFTGYFDERFISIAISKKQEEMDEGFGMIRGDASPEKAVDYLAVLPGCPCFDTFLNRETPFHTIVIRGIDDDLFVNVNQFMLRTMCDRVREGAEILKKITSPRRVVLVTDNKSAAAAGNMDMEVFGIDPVYPNAMPEMIMKNLFGGMVPAGKNNMHAGVRFINAEALIALADAFNRGIPPVCKMVSVTSINGVSEIVRTPIGTPIKNILEDLNIETHSGDRIITGGPMRGRSIYSEESPVLWDTDAIMLQDKSEIEQGKNIPCINCGECVRVCPANVPVNMLVRLLENGLYEDAAREYDLLSCIECGLCSYVCVAGIPVVHYIILGKHELHRLTEREEINA